MSEDAISCLLVPAVPAFECADVAQWWPRWCAVAAARRDAFSRAVAGGADADRVGWAFAAGYQAALRVLDPGLPDSLLAAFCVTEAEGNFPRAIKSMLTPEGGGFRLDGEKRWTTLGPGGGLFIVVARLAGCDEARPMLKAVRVRSGTPGLAIESMPPTGFVPEVPHARIRLAGVRVEAADLLEGDAYARHVKPFRTIEDVHVNAACIAYLVREALRRDWAQAWVGRALAQLHALGRLATLDPSAPQTHVALGGALALGARLIAEADGFWQAAPPGDPAAARWVRDRDLFGVAGKARSARLAAAWERLG